MNFKTYQNQLSRLSARFNLMVVLVFGLLVSNILLAGLSWYTSVHQRIEITPFTLSGGYIKSQAMVDSNYLSLMAENFIYSRLNVSPETVDANHQRLLKYVDSKNYPEMIARLNKEASLIKASKISSVFDISQIRVNPSDYTVQVKGILKRFVGIRALPEERLEYQIGFRYHLGQLSILRFIHSKEDSHA